MRQSCKTCRMGTSQRSRDIGYTHMDNASNVEKAARDWKEPIRAETMNDALAGSTPGPEGGRAVDGHAA